MEVQIITIFCIIDDFLKAINFQDDIQVKMTTSEVLTAAIVAGWYFGGNHEKSRVFLQEHYYIKYILSKSRLNRRLHAIDSSVFEQLFSAFAETFKMALKEKEFTVDSCPVPVCHNIRISRCKIYKREEFRGYSASKKQYFYGLRIHMLATTEGAPVEFVLAPGSWNDCRVFKQFDCDLPEGSSVYLDAAYNDYAHEDLLYEALGITLFAARKENSKRPHIPALEYLISVKRKRAETNFSILTGMFPKSIHAVTPKGFELKLVFFIFAYAITFLV